MFLLLSIFINGKDVLIANQLSGLMVIVVVVEGVVAVVMNLLQREGQPNGKAALRFDGCCSRCCGSGCCCYQSSSMGKTS